MLFFTLTYLGRWYIYVCVCVLTLCATQCNCSPPTSNKPHIYLLEARIILNLNFRVEGRWLLHLSPYCWKFWPVVFPSSGWKSHHQLRISRKANLKLHIMAKKTSFCHTKGLLWHYTVVCIVNLVHCACCSWGHVCMPSAKPSWYWLSYIYSPFTSFPCLATCSGALAKFPVPIWPVEDISGWK